MRGLTPPTERRRRFPECSSTRAKLSKKDLPTRTAYRRRARVSCGPTVSWPGARCQRGLNLRRS